MGGVHYRSRHTDSAKRSARHAGTGPTRGTGSAVLVYDLGMSDDSPKSEKDEPPLPPRYKPEDTVKDEPDAQADSSEGRPAEPAPDPDRKVYMGTGFFSSLIVGILVAAAVIILAAQNVGDAAVQFLGWEFEVPLIALILGSVLAGIVLAELIGVFYRRRRRRILNEREELKRLRAERNT
jgi:uncharacterized integral membrane protein